jgi:Na+/melibiose symporter-like transporter
MAYGGLQMFPLAMLPDCIAADTARSGHARAGVFTGMWAAGETLGYALGPGLVLVVLALSGFISSRADEQVTQPDSAVTGVLWAFAAVPAILLTISLPFVLRYGRAAAADAARVPVHTGAGSSATAPPITPGDPS